MKLTDIDFKSWDVWFAAACAVIICMLAGIGICWTSIMYVRPFNEQRKLEAIMEYEEQIKALKAMKAANKKATKRSKKKKGQGG